jgi:hypothetical protein
LKVPNFKDKPFNFIDMNKIREIWKNNNKLVLKK